jgi:hypothetical protein
MGRFTQYPAASTADYADATTFLIANEDGVIKQASLEGLSQNFLCSTYCASIVVPSAEVLQLNSTPQTIIPAQGAGTAIDVVAIACRYTHGGTDYSGGGNILIGDSAGPQFYFNGTLQATGSRFVKAVPSLPTGTDSNLSENSDILIFTLANPTLGDGDFEFWAFYRVINV